MSKAERVVLESREVPRLRVGGREVPYSPGLKVRSRDLVFISGQVPVDASGNSVGGSDFVAQARQCLTNMQSLLVSAGGSLQEVVQLTTYLTDIDNLPRYAEVRREFFKPPFPATTVVGVSGLARPEFLIEIEAIAAID